MRRLLLLALCALLACGPEPAPGPTQAEVMAYAARTVARAATIRAQCQGRILERERCEQRLRNENDTHQSAQKSVDALHKIGAR